MRFQTKAKTLSIVEKKLKSAKIPKYYYFKVQKYFRNKKNILSFICKKFTNKVAIRSSTLVEDSKNQSMAGYFLSELNVSTKNKKVLQDKIEKVIKSYSSYKNPNNEILIQEMVTDVFISGVATTVDKETFLPYYCIDYSYSKDTSKVTAGTDITNSFI